LHSVTVEGGDKALSARSYTATLSHPVDAVDKTGGESAVGPPANRITDDFYAIWDTFRTSHPLLTLLKESVRADMVRSLIDIGRTRWLPAGRPSGDWQRPDAGRQQRRHRNRRRLPRRNAGHRLPEGPARDPARR